MVMATHQETQVGCGHGNTSRDIGRLWSWARNLALLPVFPAPAKSWGGEDWERGYKKPRWAGSQSESDRRSDVEMCLSWLVANVRVHSESRVYVPRFLGICPVYRLRCAI